MLNTALQSVSPYLMIAWRLKILACFRSASREDIQKGISKLRNRVIGRVFQLDATAPLLDQPQFQRMTAACHDRGLDTPKFEEIGTHFRVTLSAIRRSRASKGRTDQSILGALAASFESGLSTPTAASVTPSKP
jgi:hypothetical protein